VIKGGATAVTTSNGPQSGTVVVDGTAITYAGLEPVSFIGVGDVTVDGTGSDDDITVGPGASGFIDVSGLGELQSVQISSNSKLTVDGKDGKDKVTVTGDLSGLGSLALTIKAEKIKIKSDAVIMSCVTAAVLISAVAALPPK